MLFMVFIVTAALFHLTSVVALFLPVYGLLG